MKLLSGYAYLSAESEHTAVGKSRGGVDIYAGGIYLCSEACGIVKVIGHDALGMAGGVFCDMLYHFIK